MYRRQRFVQTLTLDRELMILNQQFQQQTRMLENDQHSCSQALTHQLWACGSQNLQHAHKYYSERDPNSNSNHKLHESPVKSLQEVQHKTIRSKSDEAITKRQRILINQRKQQNKEHQSDHYLFQNIRQKQNKLQGILKETTKKSCSKRSHRSVRFSNK